jgi:hypothetical protein
VYAIPFKFKGILLGLTTRKPISNVGFILSPGSILKELTLTSGFSKLGFKVAQLVSIRITSSVVRRDMSRFKVLSFTFATTLIRKSLLCKYLQRLKKYMY